MQRSIKLSRQVKDKVKSDSKVKRSKYDGNTEFMISTGSTLLDLAISGGRVYGGGIPSGIFCIAYGPSGSGKTVLACEVAGQIQRAGGSVNYKDAEARLNKNFSKIFDLDYDKINYERPDTVAGAFNPLYKWEPETPDNVNGYIVDSLAALSTDLEMDNEEGDKMGQKRAKEFSAHFRKCARVITNKGHLLFCTNQIRQKMNAGLYERKDINPGGKAVEFYPSLILRFSSSKKIVKDIKIYSKKVRRIIGIEVVIEVDKSSVWKPFRSAPVYIYFDYGIDDIRANLQFIKDYTSNKVYTIKNRSLGNSMDKAIAIIEDDNLEKKLKKQVIALWESIEEKFEESRKSKRR